MKNLKQIDCSIGEPVIIKDNFLQCFNVGKPSFNLFNDDHSFYPPTKGYSKLVSYLEGIHQAPVIITNGAKQAIAASFYAVQKMGAKELGYKKPYWNMIPKLAEKMGLKSKSVNIDDDSETHCDAYFSIMPNNPDGFLQPYEEYKYVADAHKAFKIPFIHDAAYYNELYLPYDYELGPIGDVQIFSISKSYGLSGLRLGYAVIYDIDCYKHMLDYMEHMTVGVSMASQCIMFDLFQEIKNNPENEKRFISKCREDICMAKMLMKTLDNSNIEISEKIDQSIGMFLWAKCKDKSIFEKANIVVSDGESYGMKDHIRMNLTIRNEELKQVIARLS